MINSILRTIFGTKHEREMRALQPTIDKINSFEPQIKMLSDQALQAKTSDFQARLSQGETLDQILPEAFAVCREASVRVLGMRHYDVQLIGGIILHQGKIAEMRTGEGKTLVATLPVYLNALLGQGVHVVTVNDYLARRDSEWMGRLYKWLGLSVGIIVHDMSDQERQQSYRSDICYCTNNELGFDYLRDNMKFDQQDMVQREHIFAIIDECDSILIDEARTPLIISGPAEASTDKYYEVNKIIPHLQRNTHFIMEEKSRTASLTDEGNAKVEELLDVENLYDPQHIELLHHIYQGLKAHHLYKLDVDYMIKEGEVVIVDEFTGRLMPGRRWSEGLHQAIEAKEGVKVRNENQTLATITFQNYFRMYKKLAGMTGTADTEAVEFKKIYNLDVSVIPTNRPICRNDEDDVVYKTEKAKFKAIAEDIKFHHQENQPILVGTVSIEKSETLSRYLKVEGIRHDVLNAKHHEREAEIIAQAGRKGAVTIATNMAGRGTDIILGGNPEMMARTSTQQTDGPEYEESYKKFRALCEEEKKIVLESGGLYIIGTERHDSRRIDNQLRGRSGRQGDPGKSRFYLSLEDNLMRIFNGEMIQKIMNRLNVPDDEPITARMVSRSIEGAQRKVESHNFDIRKHLLDYDNVMNQQRTIIYEMRRKIMKGEELDRTYLDMLSDVASTLLENYAPEEEKITSWNLEGLNGALQQQFGFRIDLETLPSMAAHSLSQSIGQMIKAAFDQRKINLNPFYSQIQKMVLLQAIDHHWKEHLSRIDRLKEGINLRGYAQKDPLIEYKKEAFGAFESLVYTIKTDALEKLMKIQIVSQDQTPQLEELLPSPNLEDLNYQGSDEAYSGETLVATSPNKNKLTNLKAGELPPFENSKPMNREDRRRFKKNKRR